MSTRRTVRRQVIIAIAVITVACSNSVEPLVVEPPTGPVDRDELIGTYDAIDFSVTVGGQAMDLLAAGGSMSLTLEASAQYSGQVSAPGVGEGGADVFETVEGAWTFDIVGRRVRFPAGSAFLAVAFVPSRAEDPFGILLTGTIPADQFAGTPAIDVVLEKR